MKVALFQASSLAEQTSRGLSVGNLSLFATKQDGVIYLFENRCPHRGIALEWIEHQFLDVSGLFVQCANHGALFSVDAGRCITGPCVGQSLNAIAFDISEDWVYIETQSRFADDLT